MAYIDTSSDKWNPGITGQLSGSDYRFQLDIYSRKLLFSLASRLKGNEAKFPEWQIPFDLLFNLLNLNKTNNRRYDILRSTISRIKKSTLEYRQDEKHWGKLSLFAVAKIKEDNPYSAIFRFNNDVKRYLFNLTRYCTLYPHYYRELSNNYSLWLYPILKNASSQFISKYVLSLEEIKELTFNETTTSYNPQKNKDANRNILKNILGLEKKEEGFTIYQQ